MPAEAFAVALQQHRDVRSIMRLRCKPRLLFLPRDPLETRPQLSFLYGGTPIRVGERRSERAAAGGAAGAAARDNHGDEPGPPEYSLLRFCLADLHSDDLAARPPEHLANAGLLRLDCGWALDVEELRA